MPSEFKIIIFQWVFLIDPSLINIELVTKYPKLGVVGPSFRKTGDVMRRQDENSEQWEKKREPNQFSSELIPSFM